MIEKFQFSGIRAEGFAQHYGLPTTFLDLTESLEVAAHFATASDGTGVFMVIDTARAIKHFRLAELCHDPITTRAQRQLAWALASEYPRFDLKANENQQSVNVTTGFVRTYTFKQSPSALAYFNQELLHCWSDPIAAWVTMLIGTFCDKHGALPVDVAEWLIGRVSPVDYLIIRERPSKGGVPSSYARLDPLPKGDKPERSTGTDRQIEFQPIQAPSSIVGYVTAPDKGAAFMRGGSEDQMRARLKQKWTKPRPSKSQDSSGGIDQELLWRRAIGLLLPALFAASEHQDRNRDLKEGLRLIDRILITHPMDFRALFFKAKVAHATGNHAEAYALLRQLYAIAPNELDVIRELSGECLILGHREEGLAMARRAVELAPDDAGIHANLAMALLIAGVDGATAEAETALQLNPNDDISIGVLEYVKAVEQGKIPRPDRLPTVT